MISLFHSIRMSSLSIYGRTAICIALFLRISGRTEGHGFYDCAIPLLPNNHPTTSSQEAKLFIDNSAAKQQFPPFFTVLIHRREMSLSLFSWILSSFSTEKSLKSGYKENTMYHRDLSSPYEWDCVECSWDFSLDRGWNRKGWLKTLNRIAYKTWLQYIVYICSHANQVQNLAWGLLTLMSKTLIKKQIPTSIIMTVWVNLPKEKWNK